MFALISRILNLSGRYKSRIQAAFLCAFVESILSKMPIFMAFIVFAGFADNTLTGKTCLFVGLGLLAVVVVQTVVHYLSDRLQSAAGFMIFADKRMELGNHLRKMPMGYFTSGNIGKISSVLSTDMVFIEEVSMSTIGNMMSYMLSTLVLAVFMFVLDWRLGLIAVIITLLASLVAKYMNKVSFKEAVGRQNQSENLTDAVLSFAEGIGVIKSYNLLGEKSDELTENFKKSRDVNTKFEQKMTPWTTGLNILYPIEMTLQGARCCISIGKGVIKALGKPSHVSIKISDSRDSLSIFPCDEDDVMAFRVPLKLFIDHRCVMRINSKQFVHGIMRTNQMDTSKTYVLSGEFLEEKNTAVFSLVEGVSLRTQKGMAQS